MLEDYRKPFSCDIFYVLPAFSIPCSKQWMVRATVQERCSKQLPERRKTHHILNSGIRQNSRLFPPQKPMSRWTVSMDLNVFKEPQTKANFRYFSSYQSITKWGGQERDEFGISTNTNQMCESYVWGHLRGTESNKQKPNPHQIMQWKNKCFLSPLLS